MVTIEALREAFEKISATACGTRPGHIRVVAPTLNAPRTFVVALPAKDRLAIYGYLADRMNFAIPEGGDPLVLTALEASVIVKLGMELSDIGDAV